MSGGAGRNGAEFSTSSSGGPHDLQHPGYLDQFVHDGLHLRPVPDPDLQPDDREAVLRAPGVQPGDKGVRAGPRNVYRIKFG